MENPFEQRKAKGPRASRLLELDAWIDSTLYEAGFKLSETWERITVFFRRFHVSGWRRGFFELASEGFTLGTVGAILLFALALPAFEETRGDWRSQGEFAVTFLDRYGNEIGQRGILQRDSVPVDELPEHVVNAVLATEDRRFFEHIGIDFIGLARALTENVRAQGVVQGGSTLTQQLAKNIFLSNERTVERKIKEAFLSLWLEMNLTKKEILQLYLDRAYMGGGTFGIAAAANFYFGKDVKDVSVAEAAMLAGLFKAPARYAPHINLPAARERANTVLSAMVEAGYMTEGQVLAARIRPATVQDRASIDSPDYFLDYAFEEAKRVGAGLGTHSFVARTTIDMGIQKATEESLEFHLRQHGASYRVSEGAVVVLENNGAVRAVAGGRDYGTSQFNRATKALRQTGSSFKTYVYTAAMDAGLKPASVVSDGPVSWGNWSPRNYGRSFAGRVTLADALARSINTVPVRLAKDHIPGGTKAIADITHAMGVESDIILHRTMVLGTSGMTVLDQATGYNTLANGGYAGTRHVISQISTYGGEVIYDHERDAPKPHRALSETVVADMNSMLVRIPEMGTARRAALPGLRSAGKTGTGQSYRDAWYVGFTGNYTAAVWMGNDDFTPTRNMTGGSLPAMVWQRLMAYAHQNVELKPIPGIDNPLPDPAALAKARQSARQTERAQAERPPALSSATTRLLKEMSELFRRTPPMEVPAQPETLSSL